MSVSPVIRMRARKLCTKPYGCWGSSTRPISSEKPGTVASRRPFVDRGYLRARSSAPRSLGERGYYSFAPVSLRSFVEFPRTPCLTGSIVIVRPEQEVSECRCSWMYTRSCPTSLPRKTGRRARRGFEHPTAVWREVPKVLGRGQRRKGLLPCRGSSWRNRFQRIEHLRPSERHSAASNPSIT